MKRRILTGMRTTGRLHLGHYVGALENWLRLQDDYDCYFLLADVQALTTHFDRVEGIEDSVKQVVIDWLSIGLNPNTSSFLLQSGVHEYYELTQLLSFMVNMGMLQRNPTLKQEIEDHGMREINVGFWTYPISQASDILLLSPQPFDLSNELLVPVGEDQVPHIEDTRKIARRFNNRYGRVFTLPEAKVGGVPRLGDLSGSSKKMGKSYDNAIYLSDDSETVQNKVKSGFTDPKKIRKGDSGSPEKCPIFSYHVIFRPDGISETMEGCRKGTLGCVDCKANLAIALNSMLDPIREKRFKIEQQPSQVAEAINEGTKRAREVGKPTIEAVREAMHLDYPTLNTANTS